MSRHKLVRALSRKEQGPAALRLRDRHGGLEPGLVGREKRRETIFERGGLTSGKWPEVRVREEGQP